MKSKNLVPNSSTRAAITNLTAKVKISKEYQELVPHQSEQEYKELIQSIKEDGFWESHPIITSVDGFIIDGHHRWWASQELGVEPKIVVKSFKDKLEEKLFVINSNLRRRHLNSFQRIELALARKPILQEIAKRNQSLGGKLKGKGVRIQTPLGRINQEIGKLAGVGKESVGNVEFILEKESSYPDIISKARNDIISITKAKNKIRREELRKHRQLQNNYTRLTPAFRNNCRLVKADFKTAKIAENSVQLIFTDPPYEEKYLYIYEDLAKLGSKTLVTNGHLITYCNHKSISKIMKYMENYNMQYYSILGVKLQGSFDKDYIRGITIKCKFLLWFVKCDREDDITKSKPFDFIPNLIESKTPDKDLDDWTQSPVEAEHCILYLTSSNDTVLDPMMGREATTGIASLNLKCKFIGIEIDPKNFALAESKLNRWFKENKNSSSHRG
jgi:DNA modification methylase/ParB-like chromosome segregation protein Spo0J